jgi:hypothetical protein
METLTEVRSQAIAEPATIELPVPDQVVARIQATPPPQPQPIPIPIPFPFFFASRVMIWKQDPTVSALGRRLALLPGLVLNGPQNARVGTSLPGTTPVVRDGNGDFLFPLATSPESDCVHTYSVVNQALAMWEQSRGGAAIPWAWNTGGNTDRITCRPRGSTAPMRSTAGWGRS